MSIRIATQPICFAGLLIAGLLAPAASAGVVDFTDGAFTLITDSASGTGAVSFSESVDGATLTFTATSNLVGGPRFLGQEIGFPNNGLQVGGGGGSTLEFTLSSDLPLSLERYTTNPGGFPLGAPLLNVLSPDPTLADNVISTENPINPGARDEAFESGPLALEANADYTFLISDFGAGVQGFISTFTVTVVPEPSSLGLLALAGAAACRRRR